MKKYIILLIAATLISCGETKQATEKESTPVNYETATFDELFVKIDPKEIDFNEYKLLGEDWSIITAGTESDYNSMIASWGGFGILFEKPVSWIFLNGSRYTLEKVKQYNTFTLTYVDSTYSEQKVLLGTKSGRDTDKMKNLELHAVKTPSGNMAYKEAYLIVELKVESNIVLSPDNFNTEEHKQFLINAKEKSNAKEYHNMIMGLITDVWIRK